MRRHYILSGILLILLIIDFAVAAPVLVQEKRQAGVNVAHIPGDVITMFGKRGDELSGLTLKLFGAEDRFVKPNSSSTARLSSSPPPPGHADGWIDLNQPLLSSSEEPSLVLTLGLAQPNPGSQTESGYELMNWEAPPRPSGPASSTMSSTDHERMGAHALPNPGPSTESDHEMVDVRPPPGSASPTETDHEMVDVHHPRQSPTMRW